MASLDHNDVQDAPAGGDERLGARRDVEVRAEVDDEQSVIVVRPEEAHHELALVERRAVEATASLEGDGRVLAPQPQEIGVQPPEALCALAGVSAQPASLERRAGAGIELAADGAGRRVRELAQELESAARDVARELSFVMREVHERCRGPRLLTLKQERRGWSEQQQRGERSQVSWRGEIAEPEPVDRIGDLVVVLEKMDELPRRQVEGGCAAAPALPRGSLSLKQEPVRRRRQQLLTRHRRKSL